jgi:hypothetical protein
LCVEGQEAGPQVGRHAEGQLFDDHFPKIGHGARTRKERTPWEAGQKTSVR